MVAHANQRTLVDAGVLVRTLELHQIVDVDAGLAGIGLFGGADHDTRRVHLVDDALALGNDRNKSCTNKSSSNSKTKSSLWPAEQFCKGKTKNEVAWQKTYTMAWVEYYQA